VYSLVGDQKNGLCGTEPQNVQKFFRKAEFWCLNFVIRGAWKTKTEMDGWMDGRTNGRTDGWMDGWGYVGLSLRTYKKFSRNAEFWCLIFVIRGAWETKTEMDGWMDGRMDGRMDDDVEVQ